MYCEKGHEKVALLPKQEELTAGACPVDWAKRAVVTAQMESCGISVMCRDGMAQLLTIIEDITTGMGHNGDLEMLKDICEVIAQTDGCKLASEAAARVLYSLNNYADDWNQHCLRKRCAALICPAYYSLYIDPATCTGCGACRQAAPEGAILGEDGMIHIVVNDEGLKTPDFIALCPVDAIKKAGAVKPRLPEKPVPAGSFHTGRRRARGVILEQK